MLHLYRRHLAACPHRSMTYRRCKCPVWCFGSVDGKRIRKALDTFSWERGEEILRDMDGGEPVKAVSVKEACEAFVADCKARNLNYQTIGKYELLAKELEAAFPGALRSVDVGDLRRFREGWGMGPLSSRKKLERLKTFFKFCHESGWIRTNPAKALKAPVVPPNPTLPFTDSEMEKILWAVDLYPNNGWYGKQKRERLRAFVLLLRYTGLRIGDASTLEVEKVKAGKLLLYTAKTKTPVYIPLPKELTTALAEVDNASKYFFWSGNGTAHTAAKAWQRSLSKLFELAGIEDGHAHRFRDTFSVKLLEAGVSIETVSILLGHSSMKITERHYAPWVKSRQVKLEEAIEKAWKVG